MTEQELIWEKLKHGNETELSKCLRLANEYFASTSWKAKKEMIIHDYIDKVNNEK